MEYTLELKKIPFVCMAPEGLDMWCNHKRPDAQSRKWGMDAKPVPTEYVDIWDLKEIAKDLAKYYPIKGDKFSYLSHPKTSVWAGVPGFMCSSWVPRSCSEKGYNFRFATGSYGHDLWRMLLVEDVFKWVHHHIKESKDVRTAAHIVWAMSQLPGPCPKRYWP